MTHERLQQVTMLCLDVDGVLTDGSICIDDLGHETKRFHVRDGSGIRMWQLLGNDVAIITGRMGQAVRHRADELGIRHVIQGAADKLAAFHDLLNRLDLSPQDVAVIGDDVPELPLLRVAGYAMAVADAVPEVKHEADYVTQRAGGDAAVREAIEHLLKSRGQWDEAVQRFLERSGPEPSPAP
jgi:3-deoxy-D-manno-octulosonate 8-phosphate phosphatase (KDO 8-P phosphatase)